MNEPLFALEMAFGHFTSTDLALRSEEANVSLQNSCSVTLGWAYLGPRMYSCKVCNRQLWRRAFPAVIARIDGKLRHFADISTDHLVTSVEVASALESTFRGIERKNLVLWDPVQRESNLPGIDITQRIVGLDSFYRKKWMGEPPAEIWLPLTIKLSSTESTFKRIDECAACGDFFASLTGIEEIPNEKRINGEYVMLPHRQRQPGMGLIVKSAVVRGHDAFMTDTGLYIVREPVKRLIEERQWVNVKFREVGEIVD